MEEKIHRQDQDVTSYIQLLEVKDESIVKLSNKLDEMEIAAKIEKAASPPVLGEGSWKLALYPLKLFNLLANGSSYFTAYVEKVAVGSQTDNDKDKEHLEDMVTAFQMQNKFLNKVSFIRSSLFLKLV